MKVSVVVTVWNVGEYIGKCLTSIIKQTYKNIEIIIVNDCGNDNSMDVVKSFNDGRIKIVNHSQNMGVGWARKTGIAACTGDYVIFVDGDDWIDEDFIEKLAKNAQETDADIVSGGITYVNSESLWDIKRIFPHASEGMAKFKDYFAKKIEILANKLVRRTMFDVVPYSSRPFNEDTITIMKLLYHANKVSYVDTQGYYWRQHPKSLCHRVNAFENALFKALCAQELRVFFADKGDEYKNVISQDVYLHHLRTVKQTMNDAMAQKYRAELGEITPHLLNILSI